MKTFNLLIVLMVFTSNASSQCYPVLKNMEKQPGFGTSSGFDHTFPYYHQYTSYYLNKSDSMALSYTYYDSTGWVKLNSVVIEGYSMKLLMWNNRILGYGRVARINGKKAPAQKYYGILEYSGGKWDTIPGGMFDSTFNLADAAGSSTDLYIRVTSSSYSGTVYYYDTTTKKFLQKFTYSNGDAARTKLIAGMNRVVLTNIGKVNNSVTYGFAYMENNSIYLNSTPGYGTSDFYAIDRTNDHVFSMDYSANKVIREFGTSSLTPRVIKGGLGSVYSPLHAHNGQVIYFSFSPTNSQDVYYNILCPGDSVWKNIYFMKASGMRITNPYAAVNGVFSQTFIGNYSGPHVELGEGVLLEGVAFLDRDSNCNVDSNEHRLRNYFVYSKSPDFLASAYTDDTGHYAMYVAADTLEVYGAGHLAACAGKNKINTTSGSAFQKNVPIMDPKGYDVKVQFINSIRTRWNSFDGYGAMIENNGYPVDSVDITLLLDSKLKVGNTDSNFYSKSANQANGRLYNLDYFEKRWVYASAWIDTNTTKQDTILCHKVTVSIDSMELNYANNVDSGCQVVVYSFDPNSKICAQTKVKPLTSTKLDYFIEFQNEGNDDAYDVVVVDPLSVKLDYESLKLNGSSHPYTVEFKNNQLVFTFKDIHLKPKKENEALSKGYIRFSINTKANLALGDSVENTAYIYFDLNAPVITNKSVVYVDNNVSVNSVVHNSDFGMKLYPNPAFDHLNIEVSELAPIYIFNSMGQIVDVLEPMDGSVVLDLANYQSGVYFVRSGSQSAKFIKY